MKLTHQDIDPSSNLLNSKMIHKHLATDSPFILETFSSIDSTHSYLLQQAKNYAAHGLVCVAEQQTAGYGRRGTAWSSPFGLNLYCSLCWHFDRNSALLNGLSLVIGLAIQQTLTQWGIDGVKIKWPNDIYYDGKKLAGILINIARRPNNHCLAIISFGLNVNMSKSISAQISMQQIKHAPSDRNV